MKIKLELEDYELDHLIDLTQETLDEHPSCIYKNQKEANQVYDFLKEVHDKLVNFRLNHLHKIKFN